MHVSLGKGWVCKSCRSGQVKAEAAVPSCWEAFVSVAVVVEVLRQVSAHHLADSGPRVSVSSSRD